MLTKTQVCLTYPFRCRFHLISDEYHIKSAWNTRMGLMDCQLADINQIYRTMGLNEQDFNWFSDECRGDLSTSRSDTDWPSGETNYFVDIRPDFRYREWRFLQVGLKTWNSVAMLRIKSCLLSLGTADLPTSWNDIINTLLNLLALNSVVIRFYLFFMPLTHCFTPQNHQ